MFLFFFFYFLLLVLKSKAKPSLQTAHPRICNKTHNSKDPGPSPSPEKVEYNKIIVVVVFGLNFKSLEQSLQFKITSVFY